MTVSTGALRLLTGVGLASVFVLVVPVVSAVPAEGALTFQAPGTAEGNMTLETFGPSFVVTYGGAESAAPRLVVDGEIRSFVVLQRTAEYVSSSMGTIENPTRPASLTRTPMNVGKGSIEITEALAPTTVVASIRAEAVRLPAAQLEVVKAGTRIVSGESGPAVNTLEPFRTGPNGWPNLADIAVREDSMDVRSGHIEGEREGRSTVYLAGVRLAVVNETGRFEVAARMWNETVQADPLTGAPVHWRRHVTAVTFELDGAMAWEFRSPTSHVVAPRLRLDHVATFVAPLATLRLDSEAGDLDLRNESVIDLAGDMSLEGPRSLVDGRGEFLVHGEVRTVQQARLVVRDFSGWDAAAVVAPLSILGLLAWWAVHAREALAAGWRAFASSSLLLSLSAKIRGSTVLVLPHRRGLLGLIANAGGFVPYGELRDSAWATMKIQPANLDYHLRKLYREGFIRVYRTKDRGRLFLGSREANPAPQQWISAIAGRSPLAWDVLRVVAAEESVGQKDLIDKVIERARSRGEHPSRIAVFKWLRKFEEGLSAGPQPAFGVTPRDASTRGVPVLRALVAERTANKVIYRSSGELLFALPEVSLRDPKPATTPVGPMLTEVGGSATG